MTEESLKELNENLINIIYDMRDSINEGLDLAEQLVRENTEESLSKAESIVKLYAIGVEK